MDYISTLAMYQIKSRRKNHKPTRLRIRADQEAEVSGLLRIAARRGDPQIRHTLRHVLRLTQVLRSRR